MKTFFQKGILTFLVLILVLEVALAHEEPRPHVEPDTRTAPVVLANAKKYIPLEYVEKSGIVA